MSQATAIEWTDVSWNPVHGCSKVSPGCAHCYAETLSLRRRLTPAPWTPGNAAENVQLKPHKLREPLSNTKDWRGLGAAAAAAGKTDGMLVFVNSMSDLFHEQVPNEFIAAVFGVMAAAERHTFQVLTKRPERMLEWFRWYAAEAHDRELGPGLDPSSGLEDMPADLGFQEARGFGLELGEAYGIPWPLPNVWLGVSIENRRFVHRADLLRQTPAAVRFISAEPLLGPLIYDTDIGMHNDKPAGPYLEGDPYTPCWSDGADLPELDLDGIDWLIVGGESGHEHRPIRGEWVRDLRDACLNSREERPTDEAMIPGVSGGYELTGGTAFFFKQWGGRTPKAGGRLLDGRTWDELPASQSATDASAASGASHNPSPCTPPPIPREEGVRV